MKHLQGCLLLAGLTLIVGAQAEPARMPSTADDCGHKIEQSATDRQFEQIYTREWTWREMQFPGLDDEPDANVPDDRLPRVDAAAQKKRLQYWTDVLHRLDALDPQRLSPANRVNFAVYRPQIEHMAADPLPRL